MDNGIKDIKHQRRQKKDFIMCHYYKSGEGSRAGKDHIHGLPHKANPACKFLTGRSFTLIELLVVVAIIAILASLLMPSLGKARDASKKILCANNIKQVSCFNDMYIGDYNGYLPQSYSVPDNLFWWEYLYNAGYWNISRAASLDCPLLPHTSDYRPYGGTWPEDWSTGKILSFPRYAVNVNFSVSHTTHNNINKIKSPSTIIGFSDIEPMWAFGGTSVRAPYAFSTTTEMARSTHQGIPNLAFMDGHVKAEKNVTTDNIQF